MARFRTPLLALALLGCGSTSDPRSLSCANGPPVSTDEPPAWIGSFDAEVSGKFPFDLLGRATAYQQGSAAAAYTVIDGYTTDGELRPTGELFLLLRSVAAEGEQPLTAVTLENLNDPQYFPKGAIATYADGFDETARRYTRWLLAKSGCVRITSLRTATPSAPGKVNAIVALEGEWRSNTGTLLGTGSALVAVTAPLLDLRTGVAQPLDSMRATITGPRAGVFDDLAVQASQVLHPAQTRLVIVGTQTADTTRELWLSLAGVPQQGDSIALGSITLAEARAARPTSAKSFGMLRMIEHVGTTPVVRELWISSNGYAKFDRAIQNGPLAICGSLTGRFAFTAQGTSLASPGTSLGTIDIASGHFKTKMTVLAQADTLVDQATVPATSPTDRYALAGPVRSAGVRCP